MISDRAINLIVDAEVSGQSAYTAHYQNFTWPGGNSGPTCAIGYDLGYVTPDEIRADWGEIVSPTMYAVMLAACGKKGADARAFVQAYRTGLIIAWDQAIAEFKGREVPKWEARVRHVLPNYDRLSPDSAGAILSLCYNRGCSFDLDGDRYTEMRAIKAAMIAGRFDKIAWRDPDGTPRGPIADMQRLWPNMAGLRARRIAEAGLFADGLKVVPLRPEPASSVPPAPAPEPSWLDQIAAFADRLHA